MIFFFTAEQEQQEKNMNEEFDFFYDESEWRRPTPSFKNLTWDNQKVLPLSIFCLFLLHKTQMIPWQLRVAACVHFWAHFNPTNINKK